MATSRLRHLTICIGAVDNPEARAEIAKVLDNGKTTFWLDCGNHYESGQVLLGCTECGKYERSLSYFPHSVQPCHHQRYNMQICSSDRN
jgi:hypothetical protein